MGKFVCKHCGSDDVEIKVWQNPNTGEYGGDCEEWEHSYCNNCDSHTKVIYV